MTDQVRSRSSTVRVVEVTDEREPLAHAALDLIAETFPSHERQPLSELRSEIEEKRRRLLLPYDFHLFVAVERVDAVLATASGVFLAGINAGFITYLSVRPEARRHGVGRRVRAALVDAFRADARRLGREDLSWVLGEVRTDGHWLGSLVRHRGAIPFDLTYYHPGMLLESAPAYALYREPVGDNRRELPTDEVRRIIYAVWRRGYRVRYPLERITFQAMMEELEGRNAVGIHPDYV
jgi:ribosomal protein S18 acetylase RimI-like enzyme